MLTILFKILSILGIVLLILLGIALVVILLVLFFPISYKAAGKRTAEEFWITARVKWLFGLLRMNCDYPDPGKICVKFLFFTLYDSSVEKPEKTDRTSTETTGNEKTPASAEQTTEEHTPESVGTPKLIEAEDPTAFSATAADVESAAEREDSGIPEPGTPEPAGETPGKTTDRLYAFFTRIRYTIRKICDKIKNILENIAFYKNLWNDPDTQGLLKHAGKRFGHIWKRLRPRNLTVNATVDQRQFYIFNRIQIRDQIESLKDKSDFTVSYLRQFIVRHFGHISPVQIILSRGRHIETPKHIHKS